MDGFIEALVSIVPSRLNFKTEPGEKETLKAIVMFPKGGSIKDIACDNEHFSFKTRDLTEDDLNDSELSDERLWKREPNSPKVGRDIIIEVTLSDKTPEERIRGVITVEFDHPNPLVVSENIKLRAMVGNPPKPTRRPKKNLEMSGKQKGSDQPQMRKLSPEEIRDLKAKGDLKGKEGKKPPKPNSAQPQIRKLSQEEIKEMMAKQKKEKKEKEGEKKEDK